MNKYKKLANQIRKQKTKDKMCTNKRKFNTPEEASQKGMNTYECPHCGKWHRTSDTVHKLKKILPIPKG